MAIECNVIPQTINELLIAFQHCKQVKNEDLIKLVDLVTAVYTCQGAGANYSTLISETYEEAGNISFPANTFHSFSISVLSGSIVYQGVTLHAGSTKDVEYSTLNSNPVSFHVNAGSSVLFEYLIETV